MRILQHLSAILILGLFISSCSSSNNVVSNSLIQKRKHTKGFFVNSINVKKHQSSKKAAAAAAPKRSELVQEQSENESAFKVFSSEIKENKITYVNNLSESETARDLLKARKLRNETNAKSINRLIESYKPNTVKDGIEPEKKEGGTSYAAIMSLMFSTAGALVFFPLAGLLAIIFGIIALKQIRRDGQKGLGFAVAGLILGGIEVLVTVLLVLVLLSVAGAL